MKDIPFVSYDFFGYLAPGFLVLVMLGLMPHVNSLVFQYFYQDFDTPRSQQIKAFKPAPEHTTPAILDELESGIQQQIVNTDNAADILRLQQALEINQSMQQKLADRSPQNREHFLLKKDTSPAFYLLWLGIAYILGHIMASLSFVVYESWIVGSWMRSPIINFFIEKNLPFFKDYGKPLPEPTRTKIIKSLKKEMGDESKARAKYWKFLIQGQNAKSKTDRKNLNHLGKAIYYHIYYIALQNNVTHALHERFINLYGFARNVSFSVLFSFVLLLLYQLTMHGMPNSVFWIFILTLPFLIYFIFKCYVKFYRLSYREIVLAYYNSNAKSTAVPGDQTKPEMVIL